MKNLSTMTVMILGYIIIFIVLAIAGLFGLEIIQYIKTNPDSFIKIAMGIGICWGLSDSKEVVVKKKVKIMS